MKNRLMLLLTVGLMLAFTPNLIAGVLTPQEKAWLLSHTDPAAIDVNGVWKAKSWGDITLIQPQGSRDVKGESAEYSIDGIVSGKQVFLLFSDRRTAWYSAVLTQVGDDCLEGSYKSYRSRQFFVDDAKGSAMSLKISVRKPAPPPAPLAALAPDSSSSQTFKFPSYPDHRAQDLAFTAEKAGLVIGALPVDDSKDQMTYFNVELTGRGYVPLYIVLENKSSGDSFLFDKTAITLGWVAATGAGPTERSKAGEVMAGLGGPNGNLIMGLVGEKLIANAADVQQNFLKKEVESKTLSPGTSVHGFLYAPLPKEGLKGKIDVQIPVIKAGTNEKLIMDLPIQLGGPYTVKDSTSAAVPATAPAAVAAESAPPTTVVPAGGKLALKAALVLPKTVLPKRRNAATLNQRILSEFDVELVPSLQDVFSSITQVDSALSAGDAQITLLPRIIKIGETYPMQWNAYGWGQTKAELVILLEWTVKDKAGNTVWIETVEGSSRRKVVKIYPKTGDILLENAVEDVIAQTKSKMFYSPELRKLAQ